MINTLKKSVSIFALGAALVTSGYAGTWEKKTERGLEYDYYATKNPTASYKFLGMLGFLYPQSNTLQQTMLRQGWKIHISLNTKGLSTIQERDRIKERKSKILDAVLPIIFPLGKNNTDKVRDFKIAADKTLTEWHEAAVNKNHKEHEEGILQDGKLITIYQTEEGMSLDSFNKLLKDLDNALTTLKEKEGNLFKNLPGDIKVGNTGGLYVRYGVLRNHNDFNSKKVYFTSDRINTPRKRDETKASEYHAFEDDRGHPLPDLLGEENTKYKNYVKSQLLSLLRDIKNVSWGEAKINDDNFIDTCSQQKIPEEIELEDSEKGKRDETTTKIKANGEKQNKVRSYSQVARNIKKGEGHKEDFKIIYGQSQSNIKKQPVKKEKSEGEDD